MRVGIIGGAGHVGLPLGLVLADNGHEVTLVDTDEAALERIIDGTMPFHEPGGQEILTDALDRGVLTASTDLAAVETVDAVFCVIGTPIDEHRNPQMEALLDLVEELSGHLSPGQLLLFRSTVYPGTTSIVRDRLERNGFTVGEDIYLAYAPERIAQHNAIDEIVSLPQLIGSFDEASYRQAEALFQSFVEAPCLELTPTEAELGKLFTNMWRYLTFAAVNEFYLIAETFGVHHDVNVHRILEQTSEEYPRFDVPSPGANVGGPCLTKDGWFLVDNIPYNELVSASYQVNEGIPARIIERLTRMKPDPEKITILGMTYKTDSDDPRNSVAFKLRKQLRMRGYTNVVEVEPNLPEYDSLAAAADSDWLILMTPHAEFDDLGEVCRAVDNEDCLVCDIWGHWPEMKYDSDNGYFFVHEVPDSTLADVEVAR